MNKKEIHSLVSKLSIKLIIQLILSELIYLCFLWGALSLGMLISNTIIWQPWDPIYQVLDFIEDNIVVFMAGLSFCGVVWIASHYYRKAMSYSEQLIEAAGLLVDWNEETKISLSDDLKIVEKKMNEMKLQVLKTQYVAKEAEQRKNDLIIYLAHDLKTPLTSVIGYLSLLEEEKAISKELQEKYIGIAKNKAERLEDLINEFFEITRFNLTELSLQKQKVNFNRMLEQLLWEFKPILAQKKLSFDLNCKQEKLEVMLDVDKMERVLDNLLKNAINYSYTNSTIKIEVQKTSKDLMLMVENKGMTISQDKLKRIFEQFYRLDASRSSVSGGSGVGLAIAKEIVEAHQGIIWAESENEKVRFIVKLPLGL